MKENIKKIIKGNYHEKDDVIFCVGQHELKKNIDNRNDDFLNKLRNYLKKWPNFYYFYINVFGPVLLVGKGPKILQSLVDKNEIIINLGSGPKRLSKDIINIDIFPFKGVDVVADMHNLPFADNSIDGVISEQVFEHIKNPKQVIKEIERVLKPDGYCYINVPWFYPYHASPDDYYRWTISGLKELLSDFEIIEIGLRSGPFSSLVINLSYILALIFSFGWSPLYWILVHIFMLLLFPIKFLDIIAVLLPHSSDAAAVLYIIAKKK